MPKKCFKIPKKKSQKYFIDILDDPDEGETRISSSMKMSISSK